ncbi:hypothetical protein Golomagni_03765 [Golovinomyces magnicellulatus]|nr:hypothetical protein Golomagni_03765 [Golovinomyces magnicellulatus]
MEPSTKKRKIAPRPSEKRSSIEQQASDLYKHPPTPQEAVPHSERSDFESFARHLQDAAMLIYSQANQCPYTSISVLLLRWEDDIDAEQDLTQLQKLFLEHFNFRTETWCIPSCSDPTISLVTELGRHLEYAKPDHLWIVYYNGYGFTGLDNSLFWAWYVRSSLAASNDQEDSPKIKWEDVRCLIEEAQTDILLLLDTCAASEPPYPGDNHTKQTIAAYPPDQATRDPGPRSFTFNLIAALIRLGSGRPFTIQRLHEEIVALKQNKFLQHAGLPSFPNKTLSNHERVPVYFSLTCGHTQSILIAPITQQQLISHLGSPHNVPEHEIQEARTHLEQSQLLKFNSVNDLTFEEPRALVCTTFLGEPSPEMSSFKQWLQHAPIAANKIAVEGMFHGPPTVLLISMPISIWNVLAADRTCAFLGYVNSHNMTAEYQRLINGQSPMSKAATFKELEDGKILLEARQAAASTPIMTRHDSTRADPISETLRQDTSRTDPMILGSTNSVSQIFQELGSSSNVDQKHEAEESVEMHEAAEQLKALSHVRHATHNSSKNHRNHNLASDSPSLRNLRDGSASSQDFDDNGNPSNGESLSHNFDFSSTTSRSRQRRPSQKVRPKMDTRCSLCSHAPFKDSSSLRKHIAAAHTRPFPCAFSFAGCTSTFGSKNEWKRHISSQHLCLNYYRCSSCPQSTAEGKGNEFNRKDLFTQHLRRMHAPFAIKKSLNKDDTQLQAEWESYVKEMQNSCLVIRRQPPERSACPKPDCSSIFEGAGSWDDWTEHVGRHMEKGEASILGVDRLLAKWALDEGIIERKADGEFRLVGSERDNGISHNIGYYSDSTGGARTRRSLMDNGNELVKLEASNNGML